MMPRILVVNLLILFILGIISSTERNIAVSPLPTPEAARADVSRDVSSTSKT